MIAVGSLMVELITTGKVPLLRILGRPHGLHTEATEEELLALAAYLERGIAKRRNENEGR